MSERGSFCTEYVYCDKCFSAIKEALGDPDLVCKYFDPNQVFVGRHSVDEGDPYPIIAGKCGSIYSGGEILMFEEEIAPMLSRFICHPLRISVLAESGHKLIVVLPGK